jgi:hypothetical protein
MVEMARVIASLLFLTASAYASAMVDIPVQLWWCGSSASQTWTVNGTGAEARILLNTPPAANPKYYVWDLSGPSNKTGTEIHLFSPYSNPAQYWAFDTAAGKIRSAGYARGQCAVAEYTAAGSLLQLAPCSTAPNDTSVFTFSNGVFRLSSDPSLCIDAGSFANCSLAPTSAYPFCDQSASPEVRAQDLSSRMSAAELSSFLSNQNRGVPSLGVPRMGYGEALHGLLRPCIATPVSNSTGCPTSFPHLLLLSGTFNHSLWHSVAQAIADEGRAYFNLANRTSHLVSWAPDINAFRDPRWGRGQEVAGEDPLLLSEFIYEYARGLQEGEDPRFIKFISTAKHFSMYDMENGTSPDGTYFIRQNFTAVVSRKDAAQFYWPPFLSATQRGRVNSIMCSYNSRPWRNQWYGHPLLRGRGAAE